MEKSRWWQQGEKEDRQRIHSREWWWGRVHCGLEKTLQVGIQSENRPSSFSRLRLALWKRGETSVHHVINTDGGKKTISMHGRCLGWSYFPMKRSWKSIRGDLVLSLLATFIIINPPPLWQVLMSPWMWLAIHAFVTTNYTAGEQEVADARPCFVCVRLVDSWRGATARSRSFLPPGAPVESPEISPRSDNQSAFLWQMKSRQVRERLRGEESAPRRFRECLIATRRCCTT